MLPAGTTLGIPDQNTSNCSGRPRVVCSFRGQQEVMKRFACSREEATSGRWLFLDHVGTKDLSFLSVYRSAVLITLAVCLAMYEKKPEYLFKCCLLLTNKEKYQGGKNPGLRERSKKWWAVGNWGPSSVN